MKDLIDERNEREKIQKSIIKRWNVNYMQSRQPSETYQPADSGSAQPTPAVPRQEEHTMPGQVLDGQKEENDVTQGQIEKILQEKEEVIRNLVEHGGNL